MLLYFCPDIFASSLFPFSLSPCLFLLVYHFCFFFFFRVVYVVFQHENKCCLSYKPPIPPRPVSKCVYIVSPVNSQSNTSQAANAQTFFNSSHRPLLHLHPISFLIFFVYHFRSQRHPPQRKNNNCPTMLHHSGVFEQPYNIMSSTQKKTTRKRKEIYLSIDKTVTPQHSQSAASKPYTLHIILTY